MAPRRTLQPKPLFDRKLLLQVRRLGRDLAGSRAVRCTAAKRLLSCLVQAFGEAGVKELHAVKLWG